MLKVLVFGAAGFVGRNLVQNLSKGEHELVASDMVEDPFRGAVKYIKLDLLDRSRVLEVAKGYDVIVHFAASPLTYSLEAPLENMRVNVEGTLNILEAARAHRVRKVIYSSASSVVGVVQYNPVDEMHPCTPKTPYGVAKRAVEDYIRVYGELYGLHYLIFRFFNLYGPWQGYAGGGLIPSVYRTLKEGREFQVFGDGSNTRDFIYVGDVAEFTSLAIKKDTVDTVINLGTGVGTSIIQLIDLGAKILNVKPKVVHKPSRPGEIGNFFADTKKLREVFGDRHFTPLEDGLRKTFDWLGAHAS